MAKKYIFKADGKDLAVVPVTQNERGVFYRNSSGTYYKPTLANFDNASLPSGYKKYIGGSHAKYVSNPNRNPLDFSIVAGANLTANVDVRVLGSTPNDGSWCKVQPVGSDMVVGLVHTYQWRSGTVKAGNIICKIAPQSVTGFAPHLHIDEWSNKGRKIRELILKGDFNMSTLQVGDKVKLSADTRLRVGSSITYNIKTLVAKGAVGKIIDGSRIADGYEWWDVKFLDDQGWMANPSGTRLQKTTEAITDTKGVIPQPPPPTPPVDPTLELKERINTLTKEIEGLRIELRASQSESVELKAQLEGKLAEIGELKAEMKLLEDRYGTLMIEKKTLANTNMDLVAELNELKEGRDNWLNRLADILHKLFSGGK